MLQKKLARHEASRKSWPTKFPLGGGGKPYLASGLYGKKVKQLIFSSPEPKAHKVLIVYQWSVFRRTSSVVRRPSSTLSNLNISEASWPILITFYV